MTYNTKIKELLELYNLPIDELITISSKITKENFDNKAEFCSIISAKTGKCGENCRYCAQSSHYKTKIESHPMLSVDEVKKAAIHSKENGANRFGIVTSGRSPNDSDLKELIKMVEALAEIDGPQVCASLGFLDENQVRQLKDAGLKRYHHNLNACSSYHNEVCTTHDFKDRVNTIKLVQSYGLETCVGGIIGMGESRRQRAELALEIAEFNPESVPVNFLHPIEGTPFENYHDKINEDEILRTLAIFRIALPNAVIRYAGGRLSRFSREYQSLGLKAGVNGILIGNYLTTIGIEPEEDMELLKENGMSLVK